MKKEYENFVDFVHTKYFDIKNNHKDEDWEQEYFDELCKKFETNTNEVIGQMYYWDDDTIGEVAQGILDALSGKKLLQFDCFDDEENETTVVIAITEK